MNDNRYKPVIGITGATGTLGRAFVSYLATEGYEPVCLVRQQSLEDLPVTASDSVVVGDLADERSLRELIARIDICIHLAAYVGQGSTAEYSAANVKGTRQLCEAIVKHNPACRLVFCSTIAAIRIPKWFPVVATPYARSKRRATEVVKQFQRTRGLNAVIVYPGLVYGPGDEKLVPTIIEKLKSQQIFLITGGHRDAPLIYITDLCELLFLAAIKEVAIGKEYLGVNCHPQGIHDFLRIIAVQIGANPPATTLPKTPMMMMAILLEDCYRFLRVKRAPPISRRVVDILSIQFASDSREANLELGWHPAVRPEEGIGRFLTWMAARRRNDREKIGDPCPDVV